MNQLKVDQKAHSFLRFAIALLSVGFAPACDNGVTNEPGADGGLRDEASSGVGGAGNGDSSAGGSAATGSGAAGQANAGGSTDGADALSACDAPDLIWKTAQKTTYTSYPEPGSVECVEYNGCMWEGLFAGCDAKQTEAWVEATNIAAIFPGFSSLNGHKLCIKSGETRMLVHVLDTCADSDCSGCCTENQGNKDALIDLESYTNERWGLPDGAIVWADLGEAASPCQ